MRLPRITTWGIIGACFLAFFWVSGVKAIEDDFETYNLAPLNGQNNWVVNVTSTTTSINGFGLSGSQAIEQNKTIPSGSAYNRSYTFGSPSTQCFFIKFDESPDETKQFRINFADYIVSTYYYVGSVTFYGDHSIYISDYDSADYDTNLLWPLGSWQQICLQINYTTNKTTYLIQGESFEMDHQNGSLGIDTFSFTTNGIFDADIDELNENYDPNWEEVIGNKLNWDFPRNGYEISNDEWTDWSLWYDLDEDDVGEIGNIILIVSQSSDGLSHTDWEFVSTTTELTQWTVNRADSYPDGDVYSKAKLVKVDDPGGCNTGMETSCAWTTVAETDVIHWISSSSGYTIFDNPYDRPADFYPASTTAAEEEEGGFWNAIFGRLTNVFPLSLAKQIYFAFRNATQDQGVTPVLITLQDLTGPAADEILGDTDPVMLSAQLLRDNSNLWKNYIFPFFEACAS